MSAILLASIFVTFGALLDSFAGTEGSKHGGAAGALLISAVFLLFVGMVNLVEWIVGAP